MMRPSDQGTGTGDLDLVKAQEMEHRELLSRVVDLRRHLDLAEEEEKREEGWGEEQRKRLESLLPSLSTHFAREEGEGGLYAFLERSRPELAAEVAHLREQHRIFISWGRDLRAEASREDADIQGVREGLIAFFRLLARHESREHELLQETLATRPPEDPTGE